MTKYTVILTGNTHTRDRVIEERKKRCLSEISLRNVIKTKIQFNIFLIGMKCYYDLDNALLKQDKKYLLQCTINNVLF